MLATRNLVWLGFMVLLVSAMLTPPMAAALEATPAAPQAAFGQPLADGTLKDVSGKYSSFSNTLSGFGNNQQNVWYQIIQPGTAPAGSDWEPGPDGQTNTARIKLNGSVILNSTQSGADPGTALSSPSSFGYYKTGPVNLNTLGLGSGALNLR